MRYTWECVCGEHVIVERKLAEIDIPPESCNTCPNTEFTKRVVVPPESGVKGFILVDGGVGWHSTNYTRYRSIK